jgi:glycosyltransferase involved in cell wall biosynthesis
MREAIEFTVVVPTRERADVLVHCLRTVVAQTYGNFRVIVSDNFSQDATRDIVESFGDPRIRYINTGRRLNMSDNWEFALGHVETGWVTIIGDDDGLLPNSLAQASEIIGATGVLAIRSSVCAYRWPSLTGEPFGQIRIPLQRGVEIRDSRHWLARAMDARASYPDLPMLYNGGFVDVSVLQTLKTRTGRFYRSAIPDVYTAVAIASLVDRYAYSRAPLAVNGASRHSTGTSQFSAGNRGQDSPASRFLTEQNMPFHADLPILADGHYPPSLQLLVYESWLQTAALRPDSEPTMHARQLELILATAGRYRETMEAWGRLFAERHGLDYDAIRRRADRTKLWRRPSSIWRKLARKRRVHEAGSAGAPIETVEAACRYAAEVLKSSISRGT